MDVAIQANGNIRGSILPGSLDPSRHDVSFYDITEVIGLGYGEDGYAGYPVVSTYLTGEELRRTLEVAAFLEETMGDTYFLQFSGLRYRYHPADSVLFTIPFLDQPIPTTRAVSSAEIYTGEGLQPPKGEDKGYRPLERGDEELYHLVTDSYIISFLPMAGKMIPWLDIEPKDAQGNPVPPEDFQQLTVRHDQGRELKVWETVVEYAAAQSPGEDGYPWLDSYYREASGRMIPVGGFPLAGWLYLGLAALAGLAFYLVYRRTRVKRTKG